MWQRVVKIYKIVFLSRYTATATTATAKATAG